MACEVQEDSSFNFRRKYKKISMSLNARGGGGGC